MYGSSSIIENKRRSKHFHSTGYIQRSCSLMKVHFLWNVSCFLSPSFLGFLQQRLAAGPSTGHQLVSQQSMMRPISRRLKIPKSLSPASEEEPALRAWRDGKIAMISSALLCSGSSSSGCWLPLLLALLGIQGPRTARPDHGSQSLGTCLQAAAHTPTSHSTRESTAEHRLR